MRAAAGAGAGDAYFVSGMLILTDAALWLFLAVVFDAYGAARAAAAGSPTILDEAVGFAQAVPAMLPRAAGEAVAAMAAATAAARITGRSNGTDPLPPVPWAAVLAACGRGGALARARVVTPGALAAAVGVPPAAAAALLADVACTTRSGVDAHYGVGTRGAPTLPAGMLAALARAYPYAFAPPTAGDGGAGAGAEDPACASGDGDDGAGSDGGDGSWPAHLPAMWAAVGSRLRTPPAADGAGAGGAPGAPPVARVVVNPLQAAGGAIPLHRNGGGDDNGESEGSVSADEGAPPSSSAVPRPVRGGGGQAAGVADPAVAWGAPAEP
jgi:hypothetical protein